MTQKELQSLISINRNIIGDIKIDIEGVCHCGIYLGNNKPYIAVFQPTGIFKLSDYEEFNTEEQAIKWAVKTIKQRLSLVNKLLKVPKRIKKDIE